MAQASGQVLENLPAAVASRASGKKSGKVHAGPGRPPAKTYEATDADMRGTRSITEFFGRDQHKAAQKGELPRFTVFSMSSSSVIPPHISKNCCHSTCYFSLLNMLFFFQHA